MEEIPLDGGQMSSVVKIGNTVHRSMTKWTPSVHQLLAYLEASGFEGVPRVLGMDAGGREVLRFIDGEAGYFDSHGTTPKNLWSDNVLAGAAKFLRRYHDATAAFVTTANMQWQVIHPDPERHEVICHNDFGPWNSIFAGGNFRAIIDFDTAGPGPRIDDIAYAAYSFAPLFRPEKRPQVGLMTPIDNGRKLRLFCDAYGREYCEGIMDAILARIQGVADWITAQAEAGDVRFQRKIAEGHVTDYEADIAYLRGHQDQLVTQIGQS